MVLNFVRGTSRCLDLNLSYRTSSLNYYLNAKLSDQNILKLSDVHSPDLVQQNLTLYKLF